VPVATPTYKHQCKPAPGRANARFVWQRPLITVGSGVLYRCAIFLFTKSLFHLSYCCLSAASLSHHDIQFLSLSFKNRPYANLCHRAANWRGSQPHRSRHEKDIYSFFTRTISLKCILNPETSTAVCRRCWRERANVPVSSGLYIPIYHPAVHADPSNLRQSKRVHYRCSYPRTSYCTQFVQSRPSRSQHSFITTSRDMC
jgi:hypothetical protein